MKQAYKEAMNCNYNNSGDTEYRLDIDHNAKEIVLSFAGSSEFIINGKISLDWRQNFDFLVKPYKHMEHTFFVHRGIYGKYREVRDEIYDKLKGLEDYEMFIYGFSLGGGLTYLAHEDYWFKGFNPTSYAFASPRIFSWWNCGVLKKRFKNLTTVINRNDIVPKVPFRWMGYRHYGKVNMLGKWKVTFPWQWYKEHMGYKELLT